MKRLQIFGLIFALMLVLSVGLVAATGLFDNLFTGNVVEETLEWTDWLNRDNPSGTGDWETTADFQKAGQLDCDPVAIECVTLAGDAWTSTDDIDYICTTTSGGICKNENQGGTPDTYCEDYKVRFACAKNMTSPYEPAPEEPRGYVSAECKNPLRFAVTATEYRGEDITSESKGDDICQDTFGNEWYWAEWHDDNQYANWELNGALVYGDFEEYPWIWIDDQNGECYSTNNQFGLTLRLYERDGGKLNADCHGMNKYYANNFNFQVSDTGLISCNPYEGDTPCYLKRPLLCIQKEDCDGCSDFVNEKACDYAECNWDGRSCLDTIEPENLPPEASFTMSENPAIEDEWITFTSTSTDNDGRIAIYEWSIDEMPVSTNPQFSFAFGESGTHYLTLLVTDDDGSSDSLTQRILIQEEPDDSYNESICCSAEIASCLACMADKTIEEYCEYHPNTVGCDFLDEDDDGVVCCDAEISYCLACKAGLELEDFCEDNPDVLGCDYFNKEDIDDDDDEDKTVTLLINNQDDIVSVPYKSKMIITWSSTGNPFGCTVGGNWIPLWNLTGMWNDEIIGTSGERELMAAFAYNGDLEKIQYLSSLTINVDCYYPNSKSVTDEKVILLSQDDVSVTKICNDGDDDCNEYDERDDYCVDTDDHGSTSVNYDEKGTVAADNFRIAMTDVCHDTKTDWLIEYYCAGDKGMVTERKCPFGCEDGVCLKGDESNGGSGSSAGSKEKSNEQLQEQNKAECDGCLTEEACIPYGFRMDNKYCSLTKEFVNSKNKEESCQNNFECDTNLCIDGSCVSKSFLNKLKSLLNKWF